MASNNYRGIEKYVFTDVYNLFLAYKDIDEHDDNKWQQLIEDANAINNKYKNLPLCQEMVLSILKEIEFKACKTKKKGGVTYAQYEAAIIGQT